MNRQPKRYFVTMPRSALVIAVCLRVSTISAEASDPLKTIEIMFNNHTTLRNTQLQGALQRQGIKVSLYNLDAAKALSRDLSQGLPANPEAAKTIMLERLHGQGSQALNQRYLAAYQGLIKSLNYGLDRYPAIVFNQGQAVVYGVTDLQEALAVYQRWSAAQ